MIVRDELPFSFVESERFKEFCSFACPQFHPPSHRTLGRRFLEMYMKMKEELKAGLHSHRIPYNRYLDISSKCELHGVDCPLF
ncbi:unnamed protein product [Prunus brigantina]